MERLRGDETPEEIITLAYGMEEGLARLYRIVAQGEENADVAGLLVKLSGFEERHKQRLFELYVTMNDSVMDRRSFEEGIVSDMMEGGFTTDEFLEQNRAAMETMPGVINVAMMLETQALDLYLRYSHRAEEERSKEVLFGIAEEEKAHLKALGAIMDKYHQ
jgi:rubrerythrin